MDSIVGIVAKDWKKLLRENNYAVSPRYYVKALFITTMSMKNSVLKRKQEKLFSDSLKNVHMKSDPIFILGHWRSGTTFLHNLLSVDDQFCFPKIWEVNNPHTFLILHDKVQESLKRMKQTERPMDNVVVSRFSPAEEEFALATLTLKSPLIGWMFPKNQCFYDRYLTFSDMSQSEIKKWKSAYYEFCLGLLFNNKKQLLLKSPPNTARIKLLLEIFPKAKFIHIHRNPYKVFQSTQRLFDTAVKTSSLQNENSIDLNKKIINQYLDLYNAYFTQKELIPSNKLVEIKFEELKKNPIEQIKRVYSELGISGFSTFESKLLDHLSSIKSYKQNVYEPVDHLLKEQIGTAWKRCFNEWDYKP
jgi:omega-hydroxy-beta-dihydromenaquinone-9 sulfotransferase